MILLRPISALRMTFALGSALACAAAISAVGDVDARTVLDRARPVVIAHRGYSAVAPENTLGAFRLAVASGADLVELDYHHSSDGVPVVIHDSSLDRTTDAVARWGGKNHRVVERTAAELATLDAGRWFDGRTGERLPLLAETLESITSAHSLTLIERKAGDAATLAHLLHERGWVNHVVVQSFDWKFLRELHALLPEQIIAALGPPHARRVGATPLREGQPDDEAWSELADAGVRVVVWDRNLSAANIAAAHARGLKVWVYTIDEPAVVRELRARGVDGFITNNPSMLWKTLGDPR